MSIMDDINIDVYQQVMDLKEKLKQSEAERTRLEEMFNVLLKTFKEEETLRVKSLESRYQSFLEDCTRRSYRNEKILRSVERVENGANVLFAKTQRLKLLRNHYEAYMERVIPAWRETSLQYGSNQFSTPQKMEWFRQNQLISKEIEGPLYGNYMENSPTSKSKMPFNAEFRCFPSHHSSDVQDLNRQRFNKHLPDSKNYFNRNYMNETSGESKERERLKIYNSEKDNKIQDSPNLQMFVPRRFNQGKPLFQEEGMEYDEGMMVKELELGLSNKLTFGNVDNERKNMFQESLYKSMPNNSTRNLDYCKRPDQSTLKSFPSDKFLKSNYDHFVEESKTTSDISKGFEEEFLNDRPTMIREPVEIKKPEVIVGKLHPEATLKFEHFNNPINTETPQSQNSNQDNSGAKAALNELTQEKDKMKIESSTLVPPNNWSLLRQKNSINILKEAMMFEGKDERKMVEVKTPREVSMRSERQSFYDSPESNSDKVDVKSNEIPVNVLESSHERTEEEKPQINNNNNNHRLVLQGNSEETESNQENFNTEFNKPDDDVKNSETDDLNELNEEICEDNEDSYPESYFEQPPKPDYSRNIASNVILEEDESEVYANEGISEPHWEKEITEITEGEQLQFGPIEENKHNPEYEADATQELVGDQYQDLQAVQSGINEGDTYVNDSNYNEFQQEQYMYENQEYNQSEGYNAEQYHAIDSEGNGYYQQPPVIDNYEQEQVYNNEEENFENSSVMQEYNGNYQQEYNQNNATDANFCDRGEYDGGYYETQFQESHEEQENIDVTKDNATAENDRNEGVHYVDDINDLPLRQSNLANFLESDSESFQMEHGASLANEDSDFDFSLSQKQ